MIAVLESEPTLLALKIAFLVALYLFIVLVIRSATRDLRLAPQESVIISARDAAEARSALTAPLRRLEVVTSPVLAPGTTVEIRGQTRVGRGPENAIRLDGDDYVSGRHAVVESRPDGLWISDAGSTNGTFVNDARVTSERLLQKGDLIRVGRTDLRVEA